MCTYRLPTSEGRSGVSHEQSGSSAVHLGRSPGSSGSPCLSRPSLPGVWGGLSSAHGGEHVSLYAGMVALCFLGRALRTVDTDQTTPSRPRRPRP